MVSDAIPLRHRYRVTFERISRNHHPAPIECDAYDADELAEKLYRAVKGQVVSREVEVIVDLEAMTAVIVVGGFQTAGSGSVEWL